MKLALALLVLPLASCGMLAPDHAELALQAIDRMLAEGVVTVEQAEALRQALMTNAQPNWWLAVAQVALEVGLAVLGVRVWRGPAATAAERVARAASK